MIGNYRIGDICIHLYRSYINVCIYEKKTNERIFEFVRFLEAHEITNDSEDL